MNVQPFKATTVKKSVTAMPNGFAITRDSTHVVCRRRANPETQNQSIDAKSTKLRVSGGTRLV
jgi:hypothetical protein